MAQEEPSVRPRRRSQGADREATSAGSGSWEEGTFADADSAGISEVFTSPLSALRISSLWRSTPRLAPPAGLFPPAQPLSGERIKPWRPLKKELLTSPLNT